jgi:hypothetical protein
MGLLRVVSRTSRRGATETHYRAVATLEMSDEALREADPQLRAVLAESAVRHIADDAVEAFAQGAADAPDAVIARSHFVATVEGRARIRAEFRAFYDRLARLEVELWEETRASGEPAEEVTIGFVLYPGAMSAARNRPFVLADTLEGEGQIDTIPPMDSERD